MTFNKQHIHHIPMDNNKFILRLDAYVTRADVCGE
jgi:hypothetical protein